MTLQKPPLPPASAGQPITAQAWNAILDAVGQLYDGLNALGTEELQIEVLAGTTSMSNAVVVGVSPTGDRVMAIPPHGDRNCYTLSRLGPGSWTIVVMASGYQPVLTPATVPATAPLRIALENPTAFHMPSMLGGTLGAAIQILKARTIGIEGILDIFGATVSKDAPPDDRLNAMVLMQSPSPDANVAAGTRVRLVISAAAPGKDASKDTPPKTKEVTKDAADDAAKHERDQKEAKDGKDVPDTAKKNRKDSLDKQEADNKQAKENKLEKDQKDAKDRKEKDSRELPKAVKDVRDGKEESDGGGKLPIKDSRDDGGGKSSAKDLRDGRGRVIERGVGTVPNGVVDRRVFIGSGQRPRVGDEPLGEPRDE